MGNCTASRLNGGGGGGEEDVVALCRERKRLLKAAVQRRYALAEAHSRYTNSLCDVATAVGEFVARHSTPTLITLPAPPSSSSSDPASFLRQTPSETKTRALEMAGGMMYRTSCSSSSSSSCSCVGLEGEVHAGEMGHDHHNQQAGSGGYFFNGSTNSGIQQLSTPPPPSPPPGGEFGWDFFNPFDGVRAAEDAFLMAGFVKGTDEELELKTVREQEGIPDLEEEEAEARRASSVVATAANGGGKVALSNGNNGLLTTGNDKEVARKTAAEGVCTRCCGGGGGEKGLTVVDAPQRERELLDALRDVEDHFIRAYDSGKDVSRMLEAAQRNPLNSAMEEIKENSSKIIHAIAWHRTPSSRSSSHRSFLASVSRSSSAWSDNRADVFNDYGGMISGSHSQTLGRLYAWEKKLYQEVKAGDEIQKLYQKKCSYLRSQDVKGVNSRSTDKTKAAAKDLYTRIWVTLKSAQTISSKIEKLRDDELQPQLLELLRGLMQSWKVMLESHETQNMIMSEVNVFTCPNYGKFCSDLHQLATLKLDEELQIWRSSFVSYVEAQRDYVEAIEGWLSKFLVPEVPTYYSRVRHSLPPCRVGAPPLYVICHDWLAALRRLPDRAVSHSLKAFCRDLKLLRTKQGEELQQKRRVEHLAKDLDRRTLIYPKVDIKLLEYKIPEQNGGESYVKQQGVETLSERYDHLEVFKKKLEREKAKHHESMQETQRITLNALRAGFMNAFHALADFSRDSWRMYDGLLVYYEKFKAEESRQQASCIEGEQASCIEVNGSHVGDTDFHNNPNTEEVVVS